jgi:preprotein translocase subunit SecD
MSTPSSDTGTDTFLRWFRAVVVVAVIAGLSSFVYQSFVQGESARYPFKLGLDLAGGSHLIYQADVSNQATTTANTAAETAELMNVLRDVIERRVNLFGVSEPVVYVESSSFVAEEPMERLVVELPGVTDVAAAVAEIGRTPLLEFKLVNQEALAAVQSAESFAQSASGSAEVGSVKVNGQSVDDLEPYIDTGLTGRYLESAAVAFAGGQSGQLANEPTVSIRFNSEGAALFADITKDNVGESLAIFLDGEMISAPVINEPISGGTAIVSGNFSVEEAQALAENLNFGALPVPIKLISTQTIDATLGAGVVRDSIMAGLAGLALVGLLMVLWYRLPGLVAVFALVAYVVITLVSFLMIPVTLTAAGLAGFVLSLGMAVDGNVLVFERMKEEFRSGKTSREAARIGFARAWLAIRDGNVTALLSAVILFWFGTPLIKGFALVLGIGTIISMLSAITLTRTLLMILPETRRNDTGILPYLFGVGLIKK